jgi:hypothetical protein
VTLQTGNTRQIGQNHAPDPYDTSVGINEISKNKTCSTNNASKSTGSNRDTFFRQQDKHEQQQQQQQNTMLFWWIS